jgi:dolichyl-diphosphooligosaccharide--protein glycosyltransferase
MPAARSPRPPRRLPSRAHSRLGALSALTALSLPDRLVLVFSRGVHPRPTARRRQAWYDTQSWYPLGRHIGSTTYPGLQLTAWGLHTFINRYLFEISLNDLCVFIPAGFGAVATFFTGLLCWEATRSANATTATVAFMSILPAHLMRSVAGGYDNESIAISAIVCTFYLWCRSLRSSSSWPIGLLAGVSYIYMVAAWGGYVFVLNMIGIHAGVLVLLGRFSPKLHHAYTLWYVVGTYGALAGPARYLVGWQPFQSLEQLGPLGVLLLLQLCYLCHLLRRGRSDEEYFALRVRVFACAAVLAAVGLMYLPEGYIGPLSARVRGLFIKHTKTGNPLVDSVAEHQATPPTVYWQYYHLVAMLAPFGFCYLLFEPSDAAVFVLTYVLVGAYFSAKMIRLVLILSPGACVVAGVAVSAAIRVTKEAFEAESPEEAAAKAVSQEATAAKERGGAAGGKGGGRDKHRGDKHRGGGADGRGGGGGRGGGRGDGRGGGRAGARGDGRGDGRGGGEELGSLSFEEEFNELREIWDENVETRRTCGAGACFLIALMGLLRFLPHCWNLARHLSEPQIIVSGRGPKGERVVLDDFREAYWWLRDHTPEDARVMAWWDYGYQINGVGNRTTIADGNTWNHEHIALLGKCLTSDEATSHAITRHLADYVLIWTTRYAGMYADDLAKSPHMARIGASVYSDRIGCLAADFFMERDGTPSECMKRSLLYRMHHHGIDEAVPKLTLFEEAYTTTNRMVRIFKVNDVSEESKTWRAGLGIECSSKECYPPALADTLKLKESFQQIHGL